MDLALNKDPVEGYACPLDTILYQEETQESIVPDANPDILTIISTEAQVCLTRKEALEGKAEAAGTVRVTVLYLPDGEEGPRCLELEVPFRCSAAATGVSAGCPLVVLPRVTAAETRMLNPRKVLARVELAVVMQAWTTAADTLCEPCEEPEYNLQQRVEEAERYVTMAAVEKSFAFQDEVSLTTSHPAAQTLLGHRLDLRCSEAKVIGNKLIFKGEAALQVRYRTGEGALASGRWELPFSQILEVDGAEEECSCALEVVERSSAVTLTGDEEGRTMSVHLELLAQAVLRQTRPTRLFVDAYSVTHRVEVERRPLTLTQLWEDGTAQEMARAVVETPPARSVEDCFVTLGEPRVEREEQGSVLTVQGRVTVLYTGEDGALASAAAPITAACRVKVPEGGTCRARCGVGGDVQAVATAGGIEVRLPVQFRYLTTVEQTTTVVAALSAEELEEETERPSVILRLAQPGERLWDIAKVYRTTEADILAANDLSDGEDLAGSLLLIPRSR